MPYVIEFAKFYLKKDVSVPDFLAVSDTFNEGFLSKQAGYISRKLLTDGEMWADLVLWDTMEEAKEAIRVSQHDPIARAYVSMLRLNGKGCTFRHFPVEKTYGDALS